MLVHLYIFYIFAMYLSAWHMLCEITKQIHHVKHQHLIHACRWHNAQWQVAIRRAVGEIQEGGTTHSAIAFATYRPRPRPIRGQRHCLLRDGLYRRGEFGRPYDPYRATPERGRDEKVSWTGA